MAKPKVKCPLFNRIRGSSESERQYVVNGHIVCYGTENDVLDFTNVVLTHSGSNGPCFIRAGTYTSPVTNDSESQSGMIRLYGETTADGTSYDRGIFVCLTTFGTKNIFPIAGLAEVRAQGGTGPISVMAAQFICDLHTTDAVLAASGVAQGMFGVWAKVTAIDGATTNASSKIAPIWLDNQMYGANATNGEEYTIFATTGGNKPDGFVGFETTSSGWSNMWYFDETAYDQEPIMGLSVATNTGASDNCIRISLNGTPYYIPIFDTAT